MRETVGFVIVRGTTMRGLIFGAAALALLGVAGCASSGEEVMSVEQAARSECEGRQPPPADMRACIETAEDTIREARELARLRPPPPAPRPPG